MANHWHMVDALMAGTAGMRAAGKTYLPQEIAESDEAYKQRLLRSYLFEGYKRAVETLVGRPLMETVTYSDDMGPEFQEWMDEDVDLQGTDVNAFTREVFTAAVHRGLTHILIDYPRTNGAPRLDQMRVQKIRPYAVHLEAKDVIAWRTMSFGHREVLSHLRFRRVSQVPDGEWGVAEKTQIFVMDLNYDPDRGETVMPINPRDGFVLLRVYEQSADSGEWALVGEPEKLTIPEIPLVTVYANRKGFMHGEPALMGVANLNVAHWQSASDQRNILHVCRVPILFGRNLATRIDNDGEQTLDFEIGPNRLLHSTSPDSELKYVEHTGAAIEAGYKDLETLKEEMATMALEVMTKRSGSVTATEKSIDSAAANGSLIGMIRALQMGLNRMLAFMGAWVNREDYGKLDINTDFRIATDNSDLEVLWKARLEGDLTVETFWNEALRRGVLSEDFDAERERKAIDKEREENMALLPPAPFTTPEDEDDATAPVGEEQET
jgi:hypothetical protein